MRRAFLLLLSLAVVGGCNNNKDSRPVGFGGVPRQTAIRSLISLSPSTTEILLQLDSVHPLKGRTAADNFPLYAKQVPIVAGVKPDYEKIALIAPDLIVFDGDLYGEADRKKMADLKIETYEFKGNTLDEFMDCLRDYSAKVGSEVSFSGYIDKIKSAIETSTSDSVTPKPKIAMLMVGSAGTENYAAGTKSFQGDVLKAAGGEPVGPATSNFASYPAERFIQDNPDVIFVAGRVADAQRLLSDPRFKSIKAIANRHISVANPDIATRRGSRVDTFILDLHKKIKEFAQK